MKSILQKVNVSPSSGTYPFGNIKDETLPGANDGTPIDVDTYADIHQFFEVLRLAANITANGLPDNGTNGFQTLQSLWEYLQAYCNKHLLNTLLGSYTTNDVVVLYGVGVTFPGALPGNGSYSGGAVFYNNKIYYVGADASVPVGVGETMVFDIEGDLTDGLYNSIILRGDTSGSGIADYDATTVKRLTVPPTEYTIPIGKITAENAATTPVTVNSVTIAEHQYSVSGGVMHFQLRISIVLAAVANVVTLDLSEVFLSKTGFQFQSIGYDSLNTLFYLGQIASNSSLFTYQSTGGTDNIVATHSFFINGQMPVENTY
jgi:hypothetical protein